MERNEGIKAVGNSVTHTILEFDSKLNPSFTIHILIVRVTESAEPKPAISTTVHR